MSQAHTSLFPSSETRKTVLMWRVGKQGERKEQGCLSKYDIERPIAPEALGWPEEEEVTSYT